MTDKQKILVCGDVEGNFKSLFSRIESLNKKSGPFDLLLISGKFFGINNSELEAYKNGAKKVAVPTFILGPCYKSQETLYPEKEGDEICPNVSYLGKRGVYNTTSGLKIAYLSGMQSNDNNSNIMCFTGNDCLAIKEACHRGQPEYRGVDILITSDWPANVQNLNEKKVEVNIKGSDYVSWLAMHVKPRYHFVASPELYFERAPYRNHNKQHNTRELATRFISLAPIGNDQKQKWMYACSLQGINKMRMMDLLLGTTDETPCPYDENLLDINSPGSTNKNMGNGQYFYDMDSSDSGGYGKRKRNDNFQKDRKKTEFDQEKCWFCLSSPTVEKHLVICVGDCCYLALAKGPLTPLHCLILPVAHHQSYTQSPDDIKNEIKKFKKAIRAFFKSIGDVPVFFERNFKTSHLQIQCVPIPFNLAHEVAEEFEGQGSADRIELNGLSPDDDLCDVVAPGIPYFHVELPDGNQLYTRTKHSFPLQFGRDILSSPNLLNCEEKSDWKSCQLSKEDEINYVNNFRKKFTPFNFTLED